MDPHNPLSASADSSVESVQLGELADGKAETVIRDEQHWLGDAMPAGSGSTVCQRLFPPSDPESGAEPVAISPAGVELGHFVIDERIGAGGMGAVFRARDTRLGRQVALKILSPHQSRDPAAVQRFRNEARAAAQLDHDNIARAFYFGEDRGLHFIAFEYVTGTNVRDLIAVQGPFEPADAVNYTLQITAALIHTASKGVVHRDIKPSNIIITLAGRAKLVDLGLARNIDPAEASADLTSDGTTLGTFDYISPEQARDPRNVDVRSDIYSLGCTIYHMLTGKPPYPEGNAFQKLLDHQGKQPPDPTRLNPRVPESLSAVIRKMMASDPKRRFATPEALMRELMYLAGTLGLRGVTTEGLVWMSAGAFRGRFWERHLGWIATVPILLIVVLVLQTNPLGQSPRQDRTEGDPLMVALGSSGQPETTALSNPPGGNTRGRPDQMGSSIADRSDEPGSPEEAKVATAGPSPVTPSDLDPKLIPELTENGSLEKIGRGNDDPSQRPQQPLADDPVEAEPVDPMPPAPAPAPVTVTSADGSLRKSYPTLNAAMADVQDGSEIVLRYNGVRVESPLRVGRKHITIRGEKGYRPGIEFRPSDAVDDGTPSRMITITGGPVTVINAEIRVLVPRSFDEPLTLFSLQRADQVRLEHVVVSIENPALLPVSVIEVMPPPGQMPNMKKMMKEGVPAEPLKLTFRNSFIRGHADLVFVRQTDPAEISLSHCVVAVGGSLIHVAGMAGPPPDRRNRVELELVHVSTLLGENLVQINGGAERRNVPQVHVSSRDSIFSPGADGPLVAMRGDVDLEDQRRLLSWRNAGKNFYDAYRVFWWIGSDQATLDFSGWLQQWPPGGSQNQRVLWLKERAVGEPIRYDRLVLDDFRLDPASPPETRPVSNDGTVAGPDLSQLPSVPGRVIPASSQDVSPAKR